MVFRLSAVIVLAVSLGGCVQAVSAARTTLADVARPVPTTWQPICPGLEVDGGCEATSLQDIHPASSFALKPQPGARRCPPTVLGVPGWCAQF